MNIWLDDKRDPPEYGEWIVVRTAKDAIKSLITGGVDLISLDHDLGTWLTGYDVCKWMAKHNVWPREVRVHSSNPVGRLRMIWVIKRYAPLGTLTDTMPAPPWVKK